MATSRYVNWMCVALAATLCGPAGAYDWLQFNGDPAHSGNNPLEKRLTRNNVATLTQLFQVTLPAIADGAPVVLRRVQTASGLRSVVYVTTKDGWIVALDAITGATIWSHQNGPGTCTINHGTNACFTTSSPAIDPNRLYVYSYGLDGYVHKYQVGNGVEITTGGWPALVSLKPFDEKGSSALAFATSQGVNYLYAAVSGYPTDAGNYQGHVVAINLANGAQQVFNTMCSNVTVHLAANDPLCPTTRQAALWARPGVVYSAATDRIYFATGNSSFGGYTGNTGGFNWSESMLSIRPDGSGANGKPLDSYTPTNFQTLDDTDKDLGSTGPALIPTPSTSAIPHLAIQAGKDSFARLINLDDMSGAGGPGHTGGEIGAPVAVPVGSSVSTQPAVWRNPLDGAPWFYVGTNRLSGFKVSFDGSGNPSMAVQWSVLQGGNSPLVANNVLYYAGGGAVRALDPLTGNALGNTPGSFGNLHWQSPVVANGIVYMTDQASHLTAWAPTVLATDLDMNASGTADLLWHDTVSGGTGLWLMSGTGLTAASGLMTDPNWTVAQVGDLDGNDKSDLIWYSPLAGTGAWLMNGVTATATGGVLGDPAWKPIATGDFDGDGNSDIVWYNAAIGGTGLWLMNGLTATVTTGLLTDPNWKVTQVGDFNGDGKTDLVWSNAATGGTGIWLMDGATATTNAGILTVPGWRVSHVGDFNGDGKTDLIFRNDALDQTTMWLMNGTATLAAVGLHPAAGFTLARVADFDGDGRADLLWYNSSTGAYSMWLMDGTTVVSTTTLPSAAGYTVTNVADFNGDGKADLVLTSSNGTKLWLMNGPTILQQATFVLGSGWTVANPR